MSEILGVLFAIMVATMVIPKVVQYQRINTENIVISATAQQQKQLVEAATTYIKQNATAIQAVATATTPATITVAMLQAPAVRLLDPSFSATNPYGQTWQVQVLQPSAGNLQALALATGGTALRDYQVTKISSVVGAAGGFIPQNDSGIYAGGAANAYGAFAGWTIPTTNYTAASGGRPAALITFNNGQLTSNYLHRNAVPGQPQLNQMNTALSMQSNNITNVGSLSGVSAALTGSATIGGSANISGSATIGGSANISGSATVTGSVTGGSLRSNGLVEIYGVVNEGWGCTPSGAVGRDSSGLSLYCQYGVWRRDVQRTGDTMTGRLSMQTEDWGLVLRNGGGADNAQPQSGVGSVYANDYYVRAVGKWVSQIAAESAGINTGRPGTVCQPGYYCSRSSGTAICMASNGTTGYYPVSWHPTYARYTYWDWMNGGGLTICDSVLWTN